VGRAFIFGLWISASIGVTVSSVQPAPPAAPAAMFDKYCVSCHNQRLRTAGFAIDNLDSAHPAANPEAWEKVIAKLRAGSMPPPGRPRPDPATYRAVASALEQDIDRAWLAKPNPGRINAVHRLNRTEYNNAIRDLFALDVDVKPLLPGDETADGSFDNMADACRSRRRTSNATCRSRGRSRASPPGCLRRVRPSRPSRFHCTSCRTSRQSEDLPFGSRGGMAIRHDFPSDGEYAIKVRLQRQYQDYIKGWAGRSRSMSASITNC
jgi:mono/diheme cytochrome c family protein